MNKKKGITTALLSVGGILLLGKAMGFIKQMITANAFGANIQTDIINLSQGVVSDLDYIIAQALITAFVPTYIHLKADRKGEEKGFVSNSIAVFFVFAVVVSLALVTFSNLLSKILAPSYGAETSAELAKYIRIIAPSFIFVVQLAIFNALLKANEHFVPGELSGFNQSIAIILVVVLFGAKIGPDSLVVGLYFYCVLHLGFLMCFSRKYWNVGKRNPFVDQNVKKMIVMMGPLLLGYSMTFINQQVDKIIVSGMREGTITAMGYAAVLSNFVGTFIGSISGVLFTYVTQSIAEKQYEKAASLINQSVIKMITVLLPISVLTVLNSQDIVTMVFGRGKFSTDAVNSCSLALVGYGFSFVPQVLRDSFSRFQYGYGDSKRPMINSSIAIFCNIILSVILSRFIGVLGVTLATSVSVLICGVLNIFSAKRKNKYLVIRRYFREVPRWFAGASICIIISIFGRQVLIDYHILIRLTCIVLLSLIAYSIITFPVTKSLLKDLLKRK